MQHFPKGSGTRGVTLGERRGPRRRAPEDFLGVVRCHFCRPAIVLLLVLLDDQ